MSHLRHRFGRTHKVANNSVAPGSRNLGDDDVRKSRVQRRRAARSGPPFSGNVIGSERHLLADRLRLRPPLSRSKNGEPIHLAIVPLSRKTRRSAAVNRQVRPRSARLNLRRLDEAKNQEKDSTGTLLARPVSCRICDIKLVDAETMRLLHRKRTDEFFRCEQALRQARGQ